MRHNMRTNCSRFILVIIWRTPIFSSHEANFFVTYDDVIISYVRGSLTRRYYKGVVRTSQPGAQEQRGEVGKGSGVHGFGDKPAFTFGLVVGLSVVGCLLL